MSPGLFALRGPLERARSPQGAVGNGETEEAWRVSESRRKMSSNDKVELLLVGGGHAHLEVVRRLISSPLRQRVSLTLVSPSSYHHYSGMVPGFLSGGYRESEIRFALAALARRAAGRFVLDSALRLDMAGRCLELTSGRRLGYDLVSFNIGSGAVGAKRPAVRRHAQSVKPISRAVQLKERLLELTAASIGRIVVVGAGAAGVEVALAARAVLGGWPITLVERKDQILTGYRQPVQSLARRILKSRGIEVMTGRQVTAVGPGRVSFEPNLDLDSQLTVWLTGAEASPLFRESGLVVSKQGFLAVDSSLRSVSDPSVFGAGDCVDLVEFPDTPKAGVYSVRQGPVLWSSLCATIEGTTLPRYRPQSGFLSILNTADGRALLAYKGQTSHSRWAFRLKDWIDRRFMARYQRLID